MSEPSGGGSGKGASRTASLAAVIGVAATMFSAWAAYSTDRANNEIEESKRQIELDRQAFERDKFESEYLLKLFEQVALSVREDSPEFAIALVRSQDQCSPRRARMRELLIQNYEEQGESVAKSGYIAAKIQALRDEPKDFELICAVEAMETRLAALEVERAAIENEHNSFFGWLLGRRKRDLAEMDSQMAEVQLQLEAGRAAMAAAAKAAYAPSPPSPPAPSPAAPPSADAAPAAPPPVASRSAATRSLAPPRLAQREQIYLEGKALGWDVDVFWCESTPANEARAQAIAAALAEAANRGESLADGAMLGRIRVRVFAAAANAREGYRVTRDEIRGELTESPQANALSAFIESRKLGSLPHQMTQQRTPAYLSVFMCAGAAPAPTRSLQRN